MIADRFLSTINILLRWAPFIFLVIVLVGFSTLSPQFLSVENMAAILVQSSWLIVVSAGMNLTLLTNGVDLSVGATMYLSVVVLGMALPGAPIWLCFLAAVLVGSLFGAANGILVVKLGLPAFIATLATTFIGRGMGLFLSSTKMISVGSRVTEMGRAKPGGVPTPLILVGIAVAITWVLVRATPFGPYIRSLGADSEGARRAGVPRDAVTWGVYCLCGAFAGFGGFISISQIASASPAFGQGAEFLSIAAAVLGGTSLFGGRGTIWAPVVGGILIMTVQNGLVMINANPYAYPVITGAVIFLAALVDSVRTSLVRRVERRRVYRAEPGK